MIVISNTVMLNASVYDDDLLNIFSKIMPRIVLMSSQKEKINKEIDICIFHSNVDEKTATSLINKTNSNYPHGIKNYQIKFTKTTYSDISKCENSVLAFLLNSNEENIKQALEFTKKHTILTISHDSKLLINGVDISMFLGRKITPYINVNSIRKKNIKLNNCPVSPRYGCLNLQV